MPKQPKGADAPAEGDPPEDETLTALDETGPADDADDDESEALGGEWNPEAEHTLAVDRMASIADDLRLETSVMVYDVRDFLLDTIKARPKPWSATSQAEQRDVAAACEKAAEQLIRKVVEAIAARGAEPVRVLLKKVALGDDISITGTVKAFTEEETDKAVMLLHHARGKHVMLTVASADDYKATARDAETDPDEPNFGFEGGDADADE